MLRILGVTVLAAGIAAVGAGATGAAGGSPVARVVNSNDAGGGSFRAAIEAANANPSITRIEFRGGLGPIVVESPVEYVGAQSLVVAGNGAVVDGSGLAEADVAAFVASTGGDLAVTRLTIRNAPQQGLAYQVPSDATGVKRVSLVGVQILGNDGHGVLINDQEDPDDTGNPNGSGASLDVSVVGSRFAGNGFGALDRDGLRVNEGGDGSLHAVIALDRVEDNGADGIELDERGAGDVQFTVSGTRVTGNGSFDATGADLDDGMDVDESGDGALVGKVLGSASNDNFEEGWDFNENDAGDFRVDMALVEASRNVEEGVDFEEDDDFQGGGDLITTLVGVKANGNKGGDGGLKIRERGDGSVDAEIRGAEANDNEDEADGISVREQGAGGLETRIERATATGNDDAGIGVREDDDGSLEATVERSTTNGNGASGIDLDENSAGDLTATARHGTSASNGEFGVSADQGGAGAGALTLTSMVFSGNGDGDYFTEGVTLTP